MGKKLIALFEIFLIILTSVAISHLVQESNNPLGNVPGQEGKGIKFLRTNLLAWLSKGMVSAQEELYTCLENLNGTICQEYPSSTCDSQCTTTCIPTRRENTAECQIGTCFDPIMGLCSDGSPRQSCENSGGVWSVNSPAQCSLNCCLIGPDGAGFGDQAQYTTEQQCNYLGQELGAQIDWVSAGNEFECLSRAGSQKEGACVLEFLPLEQKYNCEFLKKSNCLVSGGDFYENKLCTEPALNTICELTQETSCFDETDSVHFIDSCGNKANIYDSSKLNSVSYWSDVVTKSNSCDLASSSNQFGNQESCGNCEYILGSICGEPGDGDLNPIYGNLVCNDLTCIDELGEVRKNGESWCAFDGQIGVDEGNYPAITPSTSLACRNATQVAGNLRLGNWCGYEQTTEESSGSFGRSVDTPGSRHYKKSCFDGEVRIEPCRDFRNGVCVEEINENLDFTSAACRINDANKCLIANGDAVDLSKCEENSGCFLKKVDVDEYFKFDLCVPKYPTGFDLKNSNSVSMSCEYGSQSCTYVESKGWGGWSCEVNCDCKTAKFTEQMNDLCMSLGDCGGQVNFAGEYSGDGYSVNKWGKRLTPSYENDLKKYATATPGQSADPLTGGELAAVFGINPADYEISKVGDAIGQIGLGAVAVTVAYGYAYGELGAVALTEAEIAALGEIEGAAGGSAFGGAALGAAVGAGVGYLVGTLLGLQGQGMTAVVIAGGVAGAIAGAIAATKLSAGTGGVLGSSANFMAVLGPALLWAVVAVAVVAIIVKILGIGDTRERIVDFSCMPWQPPAGGDNCDLCNSDDLGCSKYKCNSLGQNCELINPGEEEALCVDVNPGDVNPPSIDVLESALGGNLSYVNSQINVGTKIEINSGDGCLKEYEPVALGIELDEPGQCKIEIEHSGSYEDMTQFFGGSNFYKYNHTMILASPTLNSLGVSGVGPSRRGDYNAYVRCQDSSGNSNVAEYNINFCVKPTDDFTAPIITKFNPESPGYSGLNVSSFNLQFFTNEPASCKWSSENKDYSLMENEIACQNEIFQVTLDGWSCQSLLDSSGNQTSNYYFRCADQPWLGITANGSLAEDRNKNTNSIMYQIQKTTVPLEIDAIFPDGITIYSPTPSVKVDLEIHTTGGLNGNALCEYSINSGNSAQFLDTGSQSHKQKDLNFLQGTQEIIYTCQDWAGNVAQTTSTFNVEVDNQGPLITRVNRQGGTLKVTTNEQSQCAYSNEGCAFSFEEGNQMTGINYVHSTSFDSGLIYNVKCRDGFENVGQCLTVTGGY